MVIHYEIHKMKNVEGNGTERSFVRIRHEKMLTEEMIEEAIEHSCSATKADVKSVLSALSYLAEKQLAQGNRFYLPGIGWLSLTAGLAKQAQEPGYQITGKDIFPSDIKFMPKENFYKRVTADTKFQLSTYTTKSKDFKEETLWAQLSQLLSKDGYITRSDVRAFGLSTSMAKKWLNHFVEKGLLRQAGTPYRLLYFKK
jgi:nucleoid DNA-binding protein